MITKSIADGKIGEAIASSYAAVMGNFNGLVSEIESLKKQLQELQQIPPSPVPCSQLPIPDDQLPVTNDKIPDPNKNQIQNIRTTLDRKNIKVTSDQIRDAFKDAGWTGDNFNEIKKDILAALSGGDK